MTALAPLVLSISSQLIQDYLYLGDPPPPALAERGSLVAIDGGLLAIDGDQVMHFELEPASEGGWRTSTITVSTPPTAANSNILLIKAFKINGNKDGGTPTSTLNLLCFYASDGWGDGGGSQAAYAVSWLVRETGGTWQNALLGTGATGLLSQVQSLEVFDAGAGIGKFVYGLTTDFLGQQNAQLFVLKLPSYDYITTEPWSIASQRGVPEFPAARFLFMASGDAGTAQEISVCLSWVYQSTTSLVWSAPLAVNAETGPDLSDPQWHAERASVPGTLQEFLPVNGLAEWTAMVVNDAGLVYLLSFPSPPYSKMISTPLNQGVGPTSVAAVSVTRRVGQSVSMFAVGDGKLWLTRDITNVNWVPLGNAVTQFATPDYDPTVFEIYYAEPTASQANRIYHLSQDGANSVWKRQALGTSTDQTSGPSQAEPTEVGAIAIELSASHQNTGRAAQNAWVNVTSDQWVVLLANSQSYWIGPGGPDLQLQADQTGSLTIRYRATDLKFPHLTFYATEQDRPNSQTVGCRGDIIDGDQSPSTSTVPNRLAGNGNEKNFTMSTPALQAANLLPGSADDSSTTACVVQLGSYMVSHYASNNGATAKVTAAATAPTTWTFRFADGGYTCDVSNASAAQFPAPGGFLDDIGDGLNFLENAGESVGEFFVTVTEDVVTLSVGIYNLVVTDARQAGAAIGAIFANVMAGLRELEDILKEIIEFLKLLFEWEDIINTHKALKTLLQWGINFIPANASNVSNWVDEQLNGIETKITDAISQAETYLQQNDATANGYALNNNLTTPGQSQPLLTGSSYHTHLINHTSRCKYVLSRAQPHVGQVTHKNGNSSSINQAMQKSFQTPSITGQLQTFFTRIQNLLAPDGSMNPDVLFDASALALLQLSKDLITDGVAGLEVVVSAVLNAIESAADWFTNTVNATLDIPVISWLYNFFVHEPLSVLDLFCLILAVPVTILYKLIRNDEAPFDDSRVKAMGAAFDKTGKTDLSALKAFGTDSTEDASAAAGLTTAAEVLGLVAADLDLLSGIVGYLADEIALVNASGKASMLVPYQPLIAWTSWALSTLSVLCSMPILAFASFGPSSVDPVAVEKTVLFALEALPELGDFITLAATKTSRLEMLPDYGPLWDAMCGFIIYGAVFYYVVGALNQHEDDPWDYLNAIVSNINRPFRLLMYLADGADPVSWAVVASIIAATDYATTCGGTATQIGSALNG